MINKQRLIVLVALVFATNAMASLGAPDTGSVDRPNILLLLIDDQRNDTLGCAGHPNVKTPAIDRLAAEGVRFSNAFVTTSICAASRASILTGLHERSHGFTFGTPPIAAPYMASSYPALLRQAGYRTGFIGKYGVKTEGSPEASIFEVFRPHGLPFQKRQADGSMRHETEIAGDRAIEFLKGSPDGVPFCLSISFNAAHADDGNLEDHFPWPRAMDGMYEDIEIPSPRLSDPRIFDELPTFLKESMNRKRFFWRWDTPEKYQANMRAYFRMISGVDRVIARVQSELQRLGLADNTVVIYMADNGYYMGERGFAGKWSHFEQSLRVPMIVYDPRSQDEDRGQVRTEMALNIDVAPTLLALAGVEIPDRYEGRSLEPLLSGSSKPKWRSEFLCEHLMDHADIPKWEGVRASRYMYARYFEQSPVFEFLHDLQSDPDQLVNLAHERSHNDILMQMRAKCEELKERCQGLHAPGR